MKNRINLAVGLLLFAASLPAREKKPSPPACKINFVVLRDYSGKPVRNAAVIMHPIEGNGKQERGGMELKTDADGHASFDGLPYGKLRVQVLAQGFQTYGDDFDVEQPDMDITIKLKRPEGQYSIYDNKVVPEGKPEQPNSTSPPAPQNSAHDPKP